MLAIRRLALGGFAALLVLAAVRFAAGLEPTPHTGRGPFFPPDDGWESDSDLTRLAGREGQPRGEVLELRGTVRDSAGRALPEAEVVIWQTDVWGKYRHPREDRTHPDGSPIPLDPAFQYSGRTVTDAEGRYGFRTIVPGTYGRRPRHIHMQVEAPGHRPLATEVHFAGDLWGAEDVEGGGADHDRLAIELRAAKDGSGAREGTFDVVLP